MNTPVFTPLPYIPVHPNYPPALVQLAVIFNGISQLEIGQDIELRNTVAPFNNTYFLVKITGFRDNFVLAVSPYTSVTEDAEKYFFSRYSRNDYRLLTEEEYYKLYPEERDLIPGRVINIEEF